MLVCCKNEYGIRILDTEDNTITPVSDISFALLCYYFPVLRTFRKQGVYFGQLGEPNLFHTSTTMDITSVKEDCIYLPTSNNLFYDGDLLNFIRGVYVGNICTVQTFKNLLRHFPEYEARLSSDYFIKPKQDSLEGVNTIKLSDISKYTNCLGVYQYNGLMLKAFSLIPRRTYYVGRLNYTELTGDEVWEGMELISNTPIKTQHVYYDTIAKTSVDCYKDSKVFGVASLYFRGIDSDDYTYAKTLTILAGEVVTVCDVLQMKQGENRPNYSEYFSLLDGNAFVLGRYKRDWAKCYYLASSVGVLVGAKYILNTETMCLVHKIRYDKAIESISIIRGINSREVHPIIFKIIGLHSVVKYDEGYDVRLVVGVYQTNKSLIEFWNMSLLMCPVIVEDIGDAYYVNTHTHDIILSKTIYNNLITKNIYEVMEGVSETYVDSMQKKQ